MSIGMTTLHSVSCILHADLGWHPSPFPADGATKTFVIGSSRSMIRSLRCAGIIAAIVLAALLCRCLTVWQAVHANRAAANLFDADASPRSRHNFLPAAGAHQSSTSYQSTPAVGHNAVCNVLWSVFCHLNQGIAQHGQVACYMPRAGKEDGWCIWHHLASPGG